MNEKVFIQARFSLKLLPFIKYSVIQFFTSFDQYFPRYSSSRKRSVQSTYQPPTNVLLPTKPNAHIPAASQWLWHEQQQFESQQQQPYVEINFPR